MDFKKLSKIKIKDIKLESIYFTPKTHEWCLRPYEGRSKGCPNYGKPKCPPNAKLQIDYIKSFKYFKLIYLEFDFERYMNLREEEWKGTDFTPTEKRKRCVLYWQTSVKNILERYIKLTWKYDDIFGAGSGFKNRQSIESAGINVFITLKRNEISYEIYPIKKILMIALLVANSPIKKKQRLLDEFLK